MNSLNFLMFYSVKCLLLDLDRMLFLITSNIDH